MKISLRKFGGIVPKIKPKNLPYNYAVIAENCSFQESVLTSTKKDIPVSLGVKATSSTKKVTYYIKDGKEYYVVFDHFSDVIPAFEDVKNKLFYFVDYDKRMYLYTTDNQTFLAGIPKPDVSIVATQNSTHKANKDSEAAAYRLSFVDGFGNEGALSDPSNIVLVSENEYKKNVATTVTFNISNIPTGYNIDTTKLKVRLYRSNTGSTGTVWQYLDTQTINIANPLTYQDRTQSSNLLETAITAEWFAPDEDIHHLITDGKGRACIAYDNIVSISVQNVPTAFPKTQKYYIPERKIVGLAVSSYGILVLTNLDVYLLSGDDPANLGTTLLISKLPCLSKQSIISIKDRVMFASKDSIALIVEGKSEEVTKTAIDKETWDKLKVSESVGFYYQDNYILKTDSAILELAFLQKQISISTITSKYKYISASEKSNTYIALDDFGNTFLFRESTESKKAIWRSKVFNEMKHTALTCGRIYAENYPIKLKIYIDDKPVYSQEIASDVIFRVGIPKKTREWQFQIEFIGDVYHVALASSMKELRASENRQ